MKKSSSSELARMHAPVTTSVENFNKTSAAKDSRSPATSAKKRSSVDKTTPRSSQTKISTAGSVTGKSGDHSSARKSADPVCASGSEKSSSKSEQKIAAGRSSHSMVLDPSPSSSHRTSENLTKMSTSGRLGANKTTGSEGRSDHSELKGHGPKQESSANVISSCQKVSEKQPVSARNDSRPASRLSVYVSYIVINSCWSLFGHYCYCQKININDNNNNIYTFLSQSIRFNLKGIYCHVHL